MAELTRLQRLFENTRDGPRAFAPRNESLEDMLCDDEGHSPITSRFTPVSERRPQRSESTNVSPLRSERLNLVRSHMKENMSLQNALEDSSLSIQRRTYDSFVDRMMESVAMEDWEQPKVSDVIKGLQGPLKKEQSRQQLDLEVCDVAQQKVAELMVQTALFEGEEDLQRWIGSIAQQSEEWEAEHRMRLRVAPERIAELETTQPKSGLPAFTVQMLEGEVGLNVSVKEHTDLFDAPQGAERIKRVLERLIAGKDRGTVARREMAQCVGDKQLEEHLAPLSEVLNADALRADVVKERLQASKGRLDAVNRRFEEIEAARLEALGHDDTVKAERLHEMGINVSEDLLAIIRERLQSLLGTEGQQAVLQKCEAEKHVAERIQVLKQRTESLLKGIEEDLKKLDAGQKHRKDIHEAFIKDVQAAKRDNLEKLTKNEERQESLFSDAVQIFKDLADLGKARTALVKDRVALIEEEHRRAAEYSLFVKVAQSRQQALADLKSCCVAKDDIYHTLNEWAAATADHVRKRLGSLQEALKEWRLEEQQRYFAFYGRHLMHVGDLWFAKDKRERDTRLAIKLSISSAVHASKILDPSRLEKEGLQRAELEAIQRECAEKAALLEGKVRKATEDFAPTAQALADSGVRFRHPIDELQSKWAQLAEKTIESRRKYVEEDAKVANKELDEWKEKAAHLLEDCSPRRERSAGGEGPPRQTDAAQ